MLNWFQISRLLEVMGVNKREQLYLYAFRQIGQKKSGVKADIAFGCAEAVNRIFRECFGNEIGGDVSTARLYKALESSYRFNKVTVPMRGDVVISPTGYGSGAIPNGHVGIMSDNGQIMSNSSKTGLWEENYSIESWDKRYRKEGGYPVYYFRVLI